MRQRLVKDVMTAAVVTVGPATPFKQLAELLIGHDLSVLPVVDRAGRLLGIVSDADLLRRTTPYAPADRAHGPHRPGEPAKATRLVAAGLMTTEAVTVSPAALPVHAARLMQASGLDCIPVVTGDSTLVGIIGRADLLRPFIRPDHEILRAIVENVINRDLLTDPGQVEVTVNDGIVTLNGSVERRSQVQLADRLISAVEGVIAFNNQLAFEIDDADLAPPSSNRQTV